MDSHIEEMFIQLENKEWERLVGGMSTKAVAIEIAEHILACCKVEDFADILIAANKSPHINSLVVKTIDEMAELWAEMEIEAYLIENRQTKLDIENEGSY